MQSIAYRSPWALTIMSLLRERPMHPYEVRRLVRERGKGVRVDLRAGSLYRTIERLEKAGLVEPLETTREGRFPERTVYRLTEHGQGELEEWMRELLSTPGKDFPLLLQALAVLAVLGPDDARLQLEVRSLHLEAEIAAGRAGMSKLQGVLPRLFMLEEEYALELRQAELRWVQGIVEDLRTGRLSWSEEELRKFLPAMPGRPLGLTIVGDSDREGEGGRMT
jgi:DNA-binding PadR family transcriptional regulator